MTKLLLWLACLSIIVISLPFWFSLLLTLMVLAAK